MMNARDAERSGRVLRCEPESFPDAAAKLITSVIEDTLGGTWVIDGAAARGLRGNPP